MPEDVWSEGEKGHSWKWGEKGDGSSAKPLLGEWEKRKTRAGIGGVEVGKTEEKDGAWWGTMGQKERGQLEQGGGLVQISNHRRGTRPSVVIRRGRGGTYEEIQGTKTRKTLVSGGKRKDTKDIGLRRR